MLQPQLQAGSREAAEHSKLHAFCVLFSVVVEKLLFFGTVFPESREDLVCPRTSASGNISWISVDEVATLGAELKFP